MNDEPISLNNYKDNNYKDNNYKDCL